MLRTEEIDIHSTGKSIALSLTPIVSGHVGVLIALICLVAYGILPPSGFLLDTVDIYIAAECGLRRIVFEHESQVCPHTCLQTCVRQLVVQLTGRTAIRFRTTEHQVKYSIRIQCTPHPAPVGLRPSTCQVTDIEKCEIRFGELVETQPSGYRE